MKARLPRDERLAVRVDARSRASLHLGTHSHSETSVDRGAGLRQSSPTMVADSDQLSSSRLGRVVTRPAPRGVDSSLRHSHAVGDDQSSPLRFTVMRSRQPGGG